MEYLCLKLLDKMNQDMRKNVTKIFGHLFFKNPCRTSRNKKLWSLLKIQWMD